MNIYFACAITAGRQFEPVYQAIVRVLLADGHQIPTAHLADSGITALEATVSPRDVYERDVAWIRECDALVAEVSVPSHGVGYEIGYALSLEKPVLCVHQDGHAISKMISGNPHSKLRIQAYRQVDEAIAWLQSRLSLPPLDL
ncbi:MAG: nucleoside 2-deoxyribosyltransferase [Chloroflexota bacterium]